MQTIETDVAIIGAGTAGLNAVREADKAGVKWVLIESDSYGTMCAKTGCMPSKLLIAAAECSRSTDNGPIFGINIDNKQINAAAVFERVRNERDRFVSFVVNDTQALPKENRIRGHAKFIGPNSLLVDDHTRVNAQSIVIASGSTATIPPPFDTLDDDRLLLNDDIFELSTLPATLAVIGAGVVGIELGQALQRLGVSTTFFSRSNKIGAISDPVVLQNAHDVLRDEMDFHFNAALMFAESKPEGIQLTWSDVEQSKKTATYEQVLVATGRTSTISKLNIESAGITFQQAQDLWNPQTTQIGNHPIFIAGDAAGHRSLLHEASDEGRISGKNAAQYPNVTPRTRRTALRIVFSDPQIAQVGTPYSQLDIQTIEIGEASFDDQGRARVMNQHRGIIRIYASKQDYVLVGAELFAPRAEHMAHLLAWAVQQKLTVQKVLEMPVYHPVLEEGMRTALRALAKKLKVTGECRDEDFAQSAGS